MSARTVVAVLVSVAGVAGLLAAGVVPRVARRKAMEATHAAAEGPRRVAVGKATAGEKKVELSLPGSAAPMESAVLYARSSGFVRATLADIGDKVKAGQVLATIDAPETSEELRVARARLEEAELNEAIARQRSARRQTMVKDGVGSTEEAEDFVARANSASASRKTTRAEVARLSDLLSYQRVVAPFDGVVTKRHLNRGSLVASAGTPVFELSQTATLRVFVDVPQSLAADVKPGLPVVVAPPSNPSRGIEAKVVRTAGALDPATRTLRTEIHIPGDGPLLAGAFADVRFTIERERAPVLVPASAMFVRREGPQVMQLGEGDTVHAQAIRVGRDLGKDIEVVTGVAPGDVLVLNPPDDLAEGERVSVVKGR